MTPAEVDPVTGIDWTSMVLEPLLTAGKLAVVAALLVLVLVMAVKLGVYLFGTVAPMSDGAVRKGRKDLGDGYDPF